MHENPSRFQLIGSPPNGAGVAGQTNSLVRKLIPLLLIIAWGFLLPDFAFGFSAEQDGGSTTPDSAGPKWQSNLVIRSRTGLRTDSPRVLQMSRLFIEGGGERRLNDRFSFTFQVRGHYDPVGRLGYLKRPTLEARQLFVDASVKQVSLRLGLQHVIWGQADGLRVLDTINPFDYHAFVLEDFSDSRRPLWMARADWQIDKASLQLVWIPYFAPAKAPVSGNEFGVGEELFRRFAEAHPTAGGLPRRSTLRFQPTRRPGIQLRSSQGGLRYSRNLGGWDLTANYFYGWEELPTPYIRSIVGFPISPVPRITLAPRHDRKQIFGFSAANNFGPVVLRAEAGYNPRRAAGVPIRESPSSFTKYGHSSALAGMDYSPASWLWVSGQYLLQITSAPTRTLLFPRYSHLGSLYARANFFRESLRPEIFVLFGLTQRQRWVRPRLTRSFSDRWAASVGADFIGGGPVHFFGLFDDNDRIIVEVKWSR